MRYHAAPSTGTLNCTLTALRTVEKDHRKRELPLMAIPGANLTSPIATLDLRTVRHRHLLLNPETLNSEANGLSCNEKYWRLLSEPYPWRRAGGNHVPGLQ